MFSQAKQCVLFHAMMTTWFDYRLNWYLFSAKTYLINTFWPSPILTTTFFYSYFATLTTLAFCEWFFFFSVFKVTNNFDKWIIAKFDFRWYHQLFWQKYAIHKNWFDLLHNWFTCDHNMVFIIIKKQMRQICNIEFGKKN